MRLLALITVGLIGGFFSGLLGVGGGIVMVPLLVTLARFDHRQAAATSLAAIVPTAIAGSGSYLVGGEVDLLAALLIAVGGVAGAQLGVRMLRRLSIGWLRWLFLALLVAVAVRMLVEVPGRGGELELSWLTAAGLVVLGLAMGVASGIFGIGGGVIVVPVLVAVFGQGDLLAKGTSLAAIVATGLSGTISNWRAGLVRPLEALVIGVAAAAASFGGVAVAFVISPLTAAILFVALIVVSATQIAVAGIRDARR